MKAQKIVPPNNTQAQVLKNCTQVLTNLTLVQKNPLFFFFFEVLWTFHLQNFIGHPKSSTF
jgi:hypothetical protein